MLIKTKGKSLVSFYIHTILQLNKYFLFLFILLLDHRLFFFVTELVGLVLICMVSICNRNLGTKQGKDLSRVNIGVRTHIKVL